jgi:hypothetical protein
VRWDALFDDLEAQAAAADAADLAAEVADRRRREIARLRVEDRARLARGCDLTVALGAAGTFAGRAVAAGPGWLLLGLGSGGELLVHLAAVTWIGGLPVLAGEPDAVPAVDARLGLGYVLRVLAREREPVTLMLSDGSAVTGTIDRAGADFVDLAEHAVDERRRAAAVRGVRIVPYAALAAVRR